jgi:hypothetical protein
LTTRERKKYQNRIATNEKKEKKITKQSVENTQKEKIEKIKTRSKE